MSQRGPAPASGTSVGTWQVPSRTWHTGGQFLNQAPQAPCARGAPREIRRTLRTLGLLAKYKDPHFHYWEFEYLKWVKTILTRDWAIVQGGKDIEGTGKWFEIFLVLELDSIAQMDLMCLAHHGCSGRALANRILWEVLTDSAVVRPYEDLSNLVTTKVNGYRKFLDRPPKDHEHRARWNWSAYSSHEDSNFSPSVVPHPAPKRVTVEASGLPLAPPWCWRPVGAQP